MTSDVKNVFNSAMYLPAKAASHNAAPWVMLALAVILGLAYIYRRYNTSVAPVPPPEDLEIPEKIQSAYYQAPNKRENRWSTLPQPVIQVIFSLVNADTRITSKLVCKTWKTALTVHCVILPELVDVRTIPVLQGLKYPFSAKSAYRSLKKLVAHVGGWDNYNNLSVFDGSSFKWPKTNGHYKTVIIEVVKRNPLYEFTKRDPFIIVNESKTVYVKPTPKTLADLSATDLPAEIVRGITEGGDPYIIYRDGSSIGRPQGIFILLANRL
jgi:hypothetical protein